MRKREFRVFATLLLLISVLLLTSVSSYLQTNCLLENLDQRYDVLTIEKEIGNCQPAALIATLDANRLNTQGEDRGYYELLIGSAYMQTRDYFNARTAFGRAAAAYDTTSDHLMRSMARYYYGETHTLERQYDKAQQFYGEAEQIARSQNITLVLGRVLFKYGRRHFQLDEFESVIETMEAALDYLLMHPADTREERTLALQNLSQAYRRIELYEHGQVYADMAAASPSLSFTYGSQSSGSVTCSIENILDVPNTLVLEREIGACASQVPGWVGQLDAAIASATSQGSKADAQLVLGILQEYQGTNDSIYEGQRNFDRAVFAYREAGEPDMAAQAMSYLARNYLRRGQTAQAETYFGQVASNADAAPLFKGRAQFGIGQIQFERGQLETASLTLESALDSMRMAGDTSLPDQIEALEFLSRVYGDMRARQQAEDTNTLLITAENRLYGDVVNQGGGGASICDAPALLFVQDLYITEKTFFTCSRSDQAALMLASHIVSVNSSRSVESGRARLFMGLGFYNGGAYYSAQEQFDKAVLELSRASDRVALGLTYLYLSLTYLNFERDDLATSDQYMETALALFEELDDKYFFARLQTEKATRELDRRNLNPAASLLENALANFRISAYPTCNEQREVLDLLIARVYATNALNDAIKRSDFQNLRNTIDCRGGATVANTPEPTPGDPDPSSTRTIPATLTPDTAAAGGGTTCDADAIMAISDYVALEAEVQRCDAALNELLQIARTNEAQAVSEEEMAHAKLRLGLIYYYLEQHSEAIIELDRAYGRFRDQVGDPENQGRAQFFASLALIAQITPSQWVDLRASKGSNRPASLTKADGYIREIRHVSDVAGDRLTLGRAESLVADVNYRVGDLPATITSYHKALEHFRASGTSRDGVEVRLRLAQIEDERSHFDAALALFEEVLALPEDGVHPEQRTAAYLGLARHHKYFGRFEQAFEYATAARDIAPTSVEGVLSEAELADIARELGDFQAAAGIVQLYEQQLYNMPSCDQADLLRIYTGNYYVSLGNAPQAKAIFNDILETECQGRTELARARALDGLANAELVRLSGDAQTNIAIEASNGAYDRLGYERGYISARLQQAKYHQIRREWDDANSWLVAVEQRSLELNDLRGLVEATMTRVNISINRGLYTEALGLLARATTYYSQMGHTQGTNNTIESRLRIYVDQANFAEATAVIDEAQALNASLSFDSRIQYYEGRVREIQGQNELALTLYNQSSSGFGASGEVLNKVEVDLRIAGIYQRRGELQITEDLIERALAVASSQDNPFYVGQAEALLADTRVLRWLQINNEETRDALFDQVVEGYRAALVAYESAANIVGQADVYNRLGEFALFKLENGEGVDETLGGSSENFQLALARYRTIGNSYGQAEALNNLGRHFGFAGNYDEAHRNFFTALSLVDEGDDPYLRAEILTNQGLIYEYQHYQVWRAGDSVPTEFLIAARANYEAATELLSFMYAEIGNNAAQRVFGSQERTILPYSRLVRMFSLYRFSPDPLEDAGLLLYYAEQSRARSYLFALQDANVEVSAGPENEVLTEWVRLRNEIITFNRELNDLRASAGDTAETDNIQDEINARIEALEMLEASIELSAVRQLIGVNVSSLEQLQAQLPDGTGVVSYYIVDGLQTRSVDENARIIVTVVGNQPGDIRTFPILVSDLELELRRPIEALLGVRGRDAVAVADLHRLLITPIQDALDDYTTLIVVPYGELNYVPFELLGDQPNIPMLISSHDVMYAPSATVYTLLRESITEQQPTDDLTTLMIAYPGTAQNLEPLDFLDYEVEQIGLISKNFVVYQNGDANQTNLRNAIAEADIVHIAAHGVFDNVDPLQSHIALAPDSENASGNLDVLGIYSLSLRERNPLVTLSSCQLGYSEVSAGDELEGMIRAFLVSGARGVVASLWYVGDSSTADFMTFFYSYRAGGMSDLAALSQAKRDMAALYGDPSVWAGFILVGTE